MLLLNKMIMRENQTLTFDQVYSLFQREFPHVRYVDLKQDLYYPLAYLELHESIFLDVFFIGTDYMTIDKERDTFHLVDDGILLNETHVFKLYNKAANNAELLEFLYGEKISNT